MLRNPHIPYGSGMTLSKFCQTPTCCSESPPPASGLRWAHSIWGPSFPQLWPGHISVHFSQHSIQHWPVAPCRIGQESGGGRLPTAWPTMHLAAFSPSDPHTGPNNPQAVLVACGLLRRPVESPPSPQTPGGQHYAQTTTCQEPQASHRR